MNFLDKVAVHEFWGERYLEFDFYEDVNFVIGINGSGKTTVINLIVAALTADFTELDRLDFSRIEIKLKSRENRKKPTIVITKQPQAQGPFSSIEYAISSSSSEKPQVFRLDDFEEQMMLRRYPSRFMERELYRRHGRSISATLSQLVRISWLSVHRAAPDAIKSRDEQFDSTVDQRLKQLSDRLVRYFSTLGKQGSAELENFQKTVFLSMLYRKGSKPFFASVKRIDLAEEKEALKGIFEQFNVPEKDFLSRLDSHFDALAKAKRKLESPEGTGFSNADVSVLIGTERIDDIVDEWRTLLKRRQQIFQPRDQFLQIVNSMMQRKTFDIDDQNELRVTTQSGKVLPIYRLSSGEKQLLIVLGEALLQENGTWVYIADEPELSLHVRWQESLVHNLRAINANSQILFATHSPDIVSTYGDRIFNMEDML
jgi:predicted ATPase